MESTKEVLYDVRGQVVIITINRPEQLNAINEELLSDLIAALESLPPGHPLETLLREAPDFRREAAIADALLHPQERAYSVPQLFDFIKP